MRISVTLKKQTRECLELRIPEVPMFNAPESVQMSCPFCHYNIYDSANVNSVRQFCNCGGKIVYEENT